MILPIDDWQRFYTKADELGLVFRLSIPSAHDPQTPIWRLLNSIIKSGLARVNLTLPAEGPELSNPLFRELNWVLVKATISGKSDTLSMKRVVLQSPELIPSEVKKISKQKNPIEGQDGGHVVIIGTWL